MSPLPSTDAVLIALATQLTTEYGRGWGEKLVRNCLRAAETFLPPREALQAKLHQSIEIARQRLLQDKKEP